MQHVEYPCKPCQTSKEIVTTWDISKSWDQSQEHGTTSLSYLLSHFFYNQASYGSYSITPFIFKLS